MICVSRIFIKTYHLKNVPVNLRSENNLIIPKYTKIAFDNNNLNCNGAFYWNALPNDAKKANILYSFKSHTRE